MKLLLSTLFAIFPIYWLPGISINILFIFKISLFTVFIVMIVSDWIKSKAIFSKSLLFFSFLVAFTYLFSSFLHGFSVSDIGEILNIVILILIMSVIVNTSDKLANTIWDALRISPLIFGFISISIPLALVFSGFDFINPFITESYNNTLTKTGLGGTRTGWSAGASLLLCIAVYNFKTYKSKLSYANLIAAIFIAISIFIPSGRSGLVVIFIICGMTFFSTSSKNREYGLKKRFYTAILGVFFIYMIYLSYISGESRLKSEGDLNDLSSGRVEGYILSLQMIKESPFFGVGVDGAKLTQFGISYPQIHNSILRNIAEFGIFSFLSIIVFFYWIIKKINLRSAEKTNNCPDLFKLMLPPLIIFSILEPVYAFGAYFNVLIFWIVVYLSLRKIN